MGFAFSEKSLERMRGVDDRLVEVMRYALSISEIDFGIPPYGGIRTEEEQALLYSQGKSKADGIKRKSKHQEGKAVDVYAYVDGKASWDEDHLTHIAAAVLQAAHKLGVRIQWGGFWKNFKDMPHFEVIDE